MDKQTGKKTIYTSETNSYTTTTDDEIVSFTEDKDATNSCDQILEQTIINCDHNSSTVGGIVSGNTVPTGTADGIIPENTVQENPYIVVLKDTENTCIDLLKDKWHCRHSCISDAFLSADSCKTHGNRTQRETRNFTDSVTDSRTTNVPSANSSPQEAIQIDCGCGLHFTNTTVMDTLTSSDSQGGMSLASECTNCCILRGKHQEDESARNCHACSVATKTTVIAETVTLDTCATSAQSRALGTDIHHSARQFDAAITAEHDKDSLSCSVPTGAHATASHRSRSSAGTHQTASHVCSSSMIFRSQTHTVLKTSSVPVSVPENCTSLSTNVCSKYTSANASVNVWTKFALVNAYPDKCSFSTYFPNSLRETLNRDFTANTPNGLEMGMRKGFTTSSSTFEGVNLSRGFSLSPSGRRKKLNTELKMPSPSVQTMRPNKNFNAPNPSVQIRWPNRNLNPPSPDHRGMGSNSNSHSPSLSFEGKRMNKCPTFTVRQNCQRLTLKRHSHSHSRKHSGKPSQIAQEMTSNRQSCLLTGRYPGKTRLFFLCVFHVLLTVSCAQTNSSRVIKIGLMHPNRLSPKPMGNEVTVTAEYMKRKILQDYGLILDIDYINTSCEEGEGLFKFVEYKSNHRDVTAFIGPSCDTVCHTSGLLAARWKTALISYGCESTQLSNRDLYPTFVRTTGTYLEMSRFVNSIMQRFSWSRVNIVTMVDSADVWLEMADELSRNIELSTSSKKHWSVDLSDRERFQEEARNMSKDRIFIFCMYPTDTLHILTYMMDLIDTTLQDQTYYLAFITIDYANMGKRVGVSEKDTAGLSGLLDITMDVTRNPKAYNELMAELCKNQALGYHTNCSNTNFPYEFGIHSALLADSFLLLAEGVKRTLDKGIYNFTAEDLVDQTINITFEGVTGEVRILQDGSRQAEFMLHNLKNDSYYQRVARTNSSATTYADYYSELIGEGEIQWPFGGTRPRFSVCDEQPNCGELLNREDTMYTALGVALAATLAVIAGLLIVVFRRKNVRELGRKDWIIPSEKLFQAPAFSSKAATLTGSKGLASLPLIPSRQATPHGVEANVSRESLRTFVMGQIFAKVTIIDQQVVAVKPIRKTSIILTSEVIMEVNQVRRLKHPNVNQLVGACIETGNICLVWGYCTKGSLRDVLMNDNIKLDWIFKFSFISDIARGMMYLHASPVSHHGRLKSSNVVVDSNWSCKVTDLCMPHFREGETEPEGENYYDQLLWTAPELLRDEPTRKIGTKKGDIYSFSIIMQEILLRSEPFGDEEKTPEEIVELVKNHVVPQCRPYVPSSAADESILDLMKMCWDEYPLFRPSFTTICNTLKKIRMAYGTTSNLVDQMLHMLSKYADHLEELVEERTTQLEEEQKKTEELLCRMLPRSVAQELKMGNPVEPESFAAVTIFFSDIVGFTSLAAASTPIESHTALRAVARRAVWDFKGPILNALSSEQVVNMLNDLYTCFDTIIDMYDVYKVETIGDAYMVVSGLPVRNGKQHAGEIAAMALDLLSSVLTFRIRHRPEKQLELRIGIHTGPVVAGVVGLKMPRYCLFGDTVNYASRMESNGQALHIHVSPECKEYLDELGGFALTRRGPVEMKGKGTIVTYWLIGREGGPWAPIPE